VVLGVRHRGKLLVVLLQLRQLLQRVEHRSVERVAALTEIVDLVLRLELFAQQVLEVAAQLDVHSGNRAQASLRRLETPAEVVMRHREQRHHALRRLGRHEAKVRAAVVAELLDHVFEQILALAAGELGIGGRALAHQQRCVHSMKHV
tara:strand:+ start:477 stop:920 length:444 start_codon:yes stop_codon:yes gene_type:complete